MMHQTTEMSTAMLYTAFLIVFAMVPHNNQIKKLTTEVTIVYGNHYYSEIEEIAEINDDRDGFDDQDWLDLVEGNIENSFMEKLELAKVDFSKRIKFKKLENQKFFKTFRKTMYTQIH